MSFPPIIDGHNDAILRVHRSGGSLLERSTEGHLDVPRAREGGLAAGFFAVFVPGEDRIEWTALGPPPFELPLSPPVDPERAALEAAAMADLLAGELPIVRTAEELERCVAGGPPRPVLPPPGPGPQEPRPPDHQGRDA